MSGLGVVLSIAGVLYVAACVGLALEYYFAPLEES